MKQQRYDQIEYDGEWQTAATVSAKSAKGYSRNPNGSPLDPRRRTDRERQEQLVPSRRRKFSNDNYRATAKYEDFDDDDDYNYRAPRIRRGIAEEDYNDFDDDEYDDDGYGYPEDLYRGISGEPIAKEKKGVSPQLLIQMQLIICILIALAAFLIKSFGGDLYQTVNGWYQQELNSSLIITQVQNIL